MAFLINSVLFPNQLSVNFFWLCVMQKVISVMFFLLFIFILHIQTGAKHIATYFLYLVPQNIKIQQYFYRNINKFCKLRSSYRSNPKKTDKYNQRLCSVSIFVFPFSKRDFPGDDVCALKNFTTL